MSRMKEVLHRAAHGCAAGKRYTTIGRKLLPQALRVAFAAHCLENWSGTLRPAQERRSRYLRLYVKKHTMRLKFSEAKLRCVTSLQEGRYEHEARDAQSQKNLLAIDGISVESAIDLIKSTPGRQAESSDHHRDSTIQVWIFQPQGWYIKFYFLETCMFISFHESLLEQTDT